MAVERKKNDLNQQGINKPFQLFRVPKFSLNIFAQET